MATATRSSTTILSRRTWLAALNFSVDVAFSSAETPADFDGDGSVGAADLSQLLGSWNQAGLGDLDRSGIVNAADLAIQLAASGKC